MDAKAQISGLVPWRVVIITNLAGGLIYRLADEVLHPLGHRIVGVMTAPGPSRRCSNDYLDVVVAASPGLDVIVSNHPRRWAAMLAPLKPDLIICGGMPWRVPEDVLALPRLGAINIHPGLLPRHRGPSAIEWAFRSGDSELGFTVHRMDRDFDTGSILAQIRVPIEDEDDFHALLDRLAPLLPGLLLRALDRVAQGEPGEPQDEQHATYAGLLEPEWRIIDWNKPARSIHNQIRSWIGMRDTASGALGHVEGKQLQITRSRLLPAQTGAPLPPGSIVRKNESTMVIQCGDAPLELIAWSVAEAETASNLAT